MLGGKAIIILWCSTYRWAALEGEKQTKTSVTKLAGSAPASLDVKSKG